MPALSEDQKQLLIAALELTDAGKPVTPAHLETVADYFRKYREDWTEAFAVLQQRDLLQSLGEGGFALTHLGLVFARQSRRQHPRMWYWYREFYEIAPASAVHREFCERLYGADFCQHGFADVPQIDQLLQALQLKPGELVLDTGCGTGQIAEYVALRTGAHVTGIDYIPEAIRLARQRAKALPDRLRFLEGDLTHLHFPRHSFDAILSIDTFYFSEDLPDTLRQVRLLLTPAGRLGALYTARLWDDTADPAQLQPDQTPLAQALRQNGFAFEVRDLTRADYEHALLRKEILEELKPRFEEEDAMFLYDNRYGEALGSLEAIEKGRQFRYLYVARVEG